MKYVALAVALAFPFTPLMADALPKTLLFVDDEDILYRSGTKRSLEPLEKYPENPVVCPDKPWEGMIAWTSVYRDQATGKFQMWYQAYNEKAPVEKSFRCVVAYAESEDGTHWVKPNLGLFEYGDVKETNIVLIGAPDAYSDRYCNSVVVNPDDPAPEKRYKMVYYDWDVGESARRGAGTRVAFSPDGIHWTKHGPMVSKTSFGAKGRQMPFEDEDIYSEVVRKNGRVAKSWLVPLTMSDAQDVFYDHLIKKYVTYGKMWFEGPDGGSHWKHGMGRMESEDFIHWSKPEFILGPNDNDAPQTEFHTSPVFLYNDQYFSLNQILNRSAGTIDIEFMSSRDGIHWDRFYVGTPYLARGEGAVFDSGSLFTNNNMIPMGDEMWFYYGAYRGTAIGGVGLAKQELGTDNYFSGVGLATMKRDRFVAIEPDPESRLVNSRKVTRATVGKEAPKPTKPNTIGQVTLRPLDFKGAKDLSLNVDATGGEVRVELLNEEGYRIRGFSKDAAVPITEDCLKAGVAWKDKSLKDLPPGRYAVRIHLNNAKLYACTLE